MQFSPSVHPRIRELIAELDRDRPAIAAIWRETGHCARAENLLQPSYATVRNIVLVQREERALAALRARRAAVLAVEFLFNTRDRKGILLDAYDGADLERRRRRSGPRS
jgi:hypothetical protein